jgi:hypothetical protein
MGINRTGLCSVYTVLVATLLCLVFCVALPLQAQAKSLPQERSQELRQTEQVPFSMAVQESEIVCPRCGVQNDRLLLARLTAFILRGFYLPVYTSVTPLPAALVYGRVSAAAPILSKGP